MSCKEALGSLLEDERHVQGKAQLTASTHHQTRERGHRTQAALANPTDCIHVKEPGQHHEEWIPVQRSPAHIVTLRTVSMTVVVIWVCFVPSG